MHTNYIRYYISKSIPFMWAPSLPSHSHYKFESRNALTHTHSPKKCNIYSGKACASLFERCAEGGREQAVSKCVPSRLDLVFAQLHITPQAMLFIQTHWSWPAPKICFQVVGVSPEISQNTKFNQLNYALAYEWMFIEWGIFKWNKIPSIAMQHFIGGPYKWLFLTFTTSTALFTGDREGEVCDELTKVLERVKKLKRTGLCEKREHSRSCELYPTVDSA